MALLFLALALKVEQVNFPNSLVGMRDSSRSKKNLEMKGNDQALHHPALDELTEERASVISSQECSF